MGLAQLRHHELVPLRIEAHGEVQWVFRCVVRLAGEGTTALLEFDDACAEVVELEGETGPRALALAAAMDADGGTGDDDFTPHFHFHGDSAAKEVAVEAKAALVISGPEDVFYFEDCHAKLRFEISDMKLPRLDGFAKEAEDAGGDATKAEQGHDAGGIEFFGFEIARQETG